MRWLGQFGRFWYDFLIGDDWRIAIGVVVTTTAVFVAAHNGANLWWLGPAAVGLLLALSVRVEMRRHRP